MAIIKIVLDALFVLIVVDTPVVIAICSSGQHLILKEELILDTY